MAGLVFACGDGARAPRPTANRGEVPRAGLPAPGAGTGAAVGTPRSTAAPVRGPATSDAPSGEGEDGARSSPPAARTCDDPSLASSRDLCDDDAGCGYRGYCCPNGRCLRSNEPPPEELPTPTNVTARGPSAGSEAITDWIAARRAEARRGIRRYVRIPLATASEGWGCVCPSNYVGDSPDYAMDDTWIDPDWAPGAARPVEAAPAAPRRASTDDEEPDPGRVIIVDGYFTGAVAREDLRGRHDPPEWLYHPSVFRITREHGPLDERDENAGRVAFLGEPIECEVRVHDPTSPLNVRERPRLEAPVVGTLDDFTRVEVDSVRGRWSRITAPVAGWIWGERTITVCPPPIRTTGTGATGER